MSTNSGHVEVSLAEFIAGLPGVARRLLDEHQPDHHGESFDTAPAQRRPSVSEGER